MAGDKFNISTKAFFKTTGASYGYTTPANDILTSLIASFGGTGSGITIDGKNTFNERNNTLFTSGYTTTVNDLKDNNNNQSTKPS